MYSKNTSAQENVCGIVRASSAGVCACGGWAHARARHAPAWLLPGSVDLKPFDPRFIGMSNKSGCQILCRLPKTLIFGIRTFPSSHHLFAAAPLTSSFPRPRLPPHLPVAPSSLAHSSFSHPLLIVPISRYALALILGFTYHLPFTTHHSPLTIHHSPSTTHHPPSTTHHPSPFATR